jgi:hypothetical protein
MARRPDPARILEAQRAGTRARLISAGVSPERVDALLGAFLALPERQGRPWDGEAAFRWVCCRSHGTANNPRPAGSGRPPDRRDRATRTEPMP